MVTAPPPRAPRVTSPRPPWTLLRFAGAGAAGNLTHAGVFLLLAATTVPVALVNVAAVVLSTLVTNELHRRFTFRGAAGTPWWRGHGVGGATALGGLVLSTTALTLWHRWVPGAGPVSGLLVVQSVTALVGLTTFVLLRRTLTPRTPVGGAPAGGVPAPRAGHGPAGQPVADGLVPVGAGAR